MGYVIATGDRVRGKISGWEGTVVSFLPEEYAEVKWDDPGVTSRAPIKNLEVIKPEAPKPTLQVGDKVKRLGQETVGEVFLLIGRSGASVRWPSGMVVNEDVMGLVKVEEMGPPIQGEQVGVHEYVTPSPRSTLLKEADEAIHGDRNAHYGTPDINFSRIADYWGTYLGRDIKTVDVANMMILLKVARSMTLPTRDSFLDIAGYAACGWETYERQSAE